jgi:hypothetical protein
MCDVSRFPGTASKFSLIFCYCTSGSRHYRYNCTFHIPHSFHFYTETLALNFFSVSSYVTLLSAGIATSLIMYVFFFLYYYFLFIYFLYANIYTPIPETNHVFGVYYVSDNL